MTTNYTLGEHFVLQKVIGKKLYDRSVYITDDRERGKCIYIKSYDGSFKDKNKIPLFINDPTERTSISINGSNISGMCIERRNNTPVTITIKVTISIAIIT